MHLAFEERWSLPLTEGTGKPLSQKHRVLSSECWLAVDIHEGSAQLDPPVLLVNIYFILLGRWYLGFHPKEGSSCNI